MTTATETTTRMRAATLADLPRLAELFEAFRLSSVYAQYGPAHPEVSTRFIERLIGELGIVFVMEHEGLIVGMLGVLLSDHPMSGERWATEVCWWVDPAHRGCGVRLLRQAEAWATTRGAVRLVTVSPAGSADVDRLYEALGYAPVETSWQKPLSWFDHHRPTQRPGTRSAHGVMVHDDVLPDPHAYRAMALAQRFQAVQAGDVVFQRMAPCADPAVPMWIARRYPLVTPTLSFFRQGARDQVEPHGVHTDTSMGTWTAILYLTPHPPPDDGTAFWRHPQTGNVRSVATARETPADWSQDIGWQRWHVVPAQFNRLVLFPAALYHSRAILENYGVGDDARLIQVVFGTGAL